jgi:hypothetical protein
MMPKKYFLQFPLLIIIAIIIALIQINATMAGSAMSYVYSGTYEPIMWPILNVTLTINNTMIRGTLIVVSPSSQTMNQVFTGLLVLQNNTSYIATGFLGTSLIYIVSIEKLNTNPPGNNTNPISNGVLTRSVTRRSYENGGMVGVSNITGGSGGALHIGGVVNNTVSSKAINQHSLGYTLLMMVVVVTSIVISISSLLITLGRGRWTRYPDCLDRGISKVIRDMGIREPGITHRELGNYLIDRVGDEHIVRELIKMYEEGVYGGRRVDCREYLLLVKKVLKRLK